MTSNFHDSPFRLKAFALLLIPFVFAACVAAPATDAPAPMLAKTLPVVSPPRDHVYQDNRIKVRKAQAQMVSRDNPWIKRIVHADNFGELLDPVLIYAEVADQFRDQSRDSSPVIVLNGQPLTRSIVVRGENDRVYAVAPSGVQLGSKMNIQVGWFGDLSRTLSSVVEITFDSVQPRE